MIGSARKQWMLGEAAANFSGGMLLSAARLWGRMQPIAVGLILAGKGWQSLWASAGGAVGYLAFWGREGIMGALWCAGALALTLLLRARETPRQGSIGGAQVRLEQTARVLQRFQKQLLAYNPPGPDEGMVLEQLKEDLCGSCNLKAGCLEQQRLEVSLLTSEAPFPCRRGGQAELRRSREQLRRMKAARAIREDYRGALIQQYGFLADTLHSVSDRLREGYRMPRFRVQVSARSHSRSHTDGDRAAAFPGLDCKYYVALCDGMGTGRGAAAESRFAMESIREMLTAGLSPEMVMGSVNSQLALLDRGGAVTVDLAEIRLDTGRVRLYKWGAGPSWVLNSLRVIRLGSSGPPPGLGVRQGREHICRAGLGRGDILVMASDGVDGKKVTAFGAVAQKMEPGILAQQVLEDARSGEDDATVIVIRLVRKA